MFIIDRGGYGYFVMMDFIWELILIMGWSGKISFLNIFILKVIGIIV